MTLQKRKGVKRTLVGVVKSNKMNKTAVIAVKKRVKHPVFKKYVDRVKTFNVHDEKNECQIGDLVSVVESKPLSKTKTWRLATVLQRAQKAE
jgi:small subunit ribosomal protein S17